MTLAYYSKFILLHFFSNRLLVVIDRYLL